ncbi:hypothetical protein AB0N07_35875 [Streptomyces sp. NPDC051172]|uniref:hypothetical protein n=1 Tax=Streptomyces sp. NPDC051172 TaxID=3155796 RepID=UPI00342A2E89
MWAMSESVSVRCPACRREHLYVAPSYPCTCGAPVAPSLDRHGTATAVAHRAWAEDWVTLQCGSCGRRDQWPRPELGCPCGTVLRIPVAGQTAAAQESAEAAPAPAKRRRPFQPVTIRTARDAVTAAAVYLRWLGYRDIRRADQRPPSGIGIAARGLLAQVDPTVRPASLRDVECLWLTAMTESAGCAYFSLAGYTTDARSRADTLGVPLFVLDLTGAPQPVNGLADELDATGVR